MEPWQVALVVLGALTFAGGVVLLAVSFAPRRPSSEPGDLTLADLAASEDLSKPPALSLRYENALDLANSLAENDEFDAVVTGSAAPPTSSPESLTLTPPSKIRAMYGAL